MHTLNTPSKEKSLEERQAAYDLALFNLEGAAEDYLDGRAHDWRDRSLMEKYTEALDEALADVRRTERALTRARKKRLRPAS